MATERVQLLVDELVTMASDFNNSSPVIGLILKSISIVVECEHQHAAALVSKVSPLVIAIFFKFASDSVIPSLCQNIFKILSSNTECSESLQSHLVPSLLSILNTSEDKTELKSHALDILNNLVRFFPRPLSEPLMLNLFPVAIQVILSTDSATILQSGGECIRSYVSVSPDQVVAFTDNNGKSGLLHVLGVAEHLLIPGSQHSATFVGRLVSTLIQRLGPSLGNHLELLLKSVLCKLQVTQDLGVSQSLIMVFAHLIHTQMEAALNFLSSVPDSNGDSALRLVLTEWATKQQSFFGFYETKVSITAIGKLLQHGVNSNDTRLTEIAVGGDPLLHSNGLTTRSSNNIMEWTRVPLLAKLFKLLINELQHLIEQVDNPEDDSEEEEGDGCEEGVNSQSKGAMEDKNFKPCNNYIVDLDGEDPDCKNDPIYSMDIKQYLVSYLLEFCQQPYLN